MALIGNYTDKITSEYSDQPNYLAWVTVLCQPFVDIQNTVAGLPNDFDVDVAIGSQLDVDGQWVGISRNIVTPLEVYFSLDDPNLGLDQGTWFGPFDATTGLTSLPDDSYRILIKAKIANNQWDGTVPSAYIFLDQVFPGDSTFIQDNQDMTMYLGIVGPVPLNAVTTALLENGYLQVKPDGVAIIGYVTSTVLGSPVFGLDADNSVIGGLDHGAWANITGGS